MEGSGNEFLAGAGLAFDEDVDVAPWRPGNKAQACFQTGTAADNAAALDGNGILFA